MSISTNYQIRFHIIMIWCLLVNELYSYSMHVNVSLWWRHMTRLRPNLRKICCKFEEFVYLTSQSPLNIAEFAWFCIDFSDREIPEGLTEIPWEASYDFCRISLWLTDRWGRSGITHFRLCYYVKIIHGDSPSLPGGMYYSCITARYITWYSLHHMTLYVTYLASDIGFTNFQSQYFGKLLSQFNHSGILEIAIQYI